MCGASVGVREHAAAGRSNCHLYHYAGNNPVRYVDPEGKFPLSIFTPDPEKISREEARSWIEKNVCNNFLGWEICKEMYTKSMRGDASTYEQDKNSNIAIAMKNDTLAYVNRTIRKRLIGGKTFGRDGETAWTSPDLKFSMGSCKFDWDLISSTEKDGLITAIVKVHITEDFDFNPGDRSRDGEKLTAVGRKAELTSYSVSVDYELQYIYEQDLAGVGNGTYNAEE